MPLIENAPKERGFKKKAYRPWDLLGDGNAGAIPEPAPLPSGSLLSTAQTAAESTAVTATTAGASLTTAEPTAGTPLTTAESTAGKIDRSGKSGIFLSLTTAESTAGTATTAGALLTTAESTAGALPTTAESTAQTTAESTAAPRIGLRSTTAESTAQTTAAAYLSMAPRALRVARHLLEKQIENGGTETPLMRKQEIAAAIVNPPRNMAATLWDLRHNGVLQLLRSVHGRFGGSVFRVPASLHAAIMRGPLTTADTAAESTAGKLPPGSEDPHVVSSSRSLKTTTTERLLSDRLATLCERLGLDVYAVGANDLLQVWRKGVFTAEQDLVDSLEHIAFYVGSDAAKGLTHPKAWLVATLSKGYYAPPAGFVSWDERQAQAKIDAAKQKLARLRAQQREQFDLDYEIWLAELAPEKLKSLMPALADTPTSPLARAVLRDAFAREAGVVVP